MLTEARTVLAGIFLGFAAIALSLGALDLAYADRLLSDPRNPRLTVPEPAMARGGILASGGEVITAGPEPLTRVCRVPSLCHTAGYIHPSFGASGLEAAYGSALSGRDPRSAVDGFQAALRGAKGRGADLVTTIDLRLQLAAARALGGRKGAVVVLDARDGDILAVVSQPGFRVPPTRETWDAAMRRADGPFVNRALQGLYPPGSAFKIVTAAAALRARKADLRVDCPGWVAVDGRLLRESNSTAHDRVNLERALAVSCNTYFAQMGVALGRDALSRQARAFGIGLKPPCDLPAAAGSFPRPRNGAELAETAIGQGRILVSPLQMAMVAAAVANGGLIMRPRLVREVRYPVGPSDRTAIKPWRRAMTADLAAVLRKDLIAAVREGTGWRAGAAGFEVGGKTGTAQAPGGLPHAWFVGFACRGGRRLAIAVVLEHAGGGGALAAPIAAAIWRAAAGGGMD